MISRLAPAKINLYLHLHGHRPDGYHVLDSLVGFANLGDRITAAAADDVTLTIDGPFSAGLQAEDNLVMKAAQSLKVHAKCGKGAEITLHKVLPIAAGLGGGSADAAATLHVLNELWDLDYSYPQLLEVAQKLGADVPACVMSQTVYMSGIGHTLDTAPTMPLLPAVLVNPNILLSTKEVYAATQLPKKPLDRPQLQGDHFHEVIEELNDCRNDLEPAAMSLCPELSQVMQTLKVSGASLVRMCGSGSTCMGIYESMQQAQSVQEALQEEQKKWWSQATTICG
ncbi:MAG: 4-(cytidine 5'-diphospho)-2-C-methyl-D-erythritol kinase [Rickettsiales bacterium]|nr:4-(cytidine 5'-diphospho)-2-C-methyl-D-erythritol kinase [Rickettsiales bacterium]